jgi:1-phosphofructokinase
MNGKVITVTLNPTLDRTLITRFLSIGYHNQTVETTRLDPAGRGVNVSRALHSLGIPTHAVILLGHDATGRAYQALLSEEQFPISVLRRKGQTRSTMIIKDVGHNHETTIWEESAGVTEDDIQRVADLLGELVHEDDRVVFGGSLPGGIPEDTYARLVDVVQAMGVWVAINAGGGVPLRQSLTAHPDLIYLTQIQMEGLYNYPVRAFSDVLNCANLLREWGAGKVLVVLSHMDMALLVAETGVWMTDFPDIAVGTQQGRAEALIAGYLAGRLKHRPLDESLELGAAAAAYTGSQVGSEFGSFKEVEKLTDQITVTSVDESDDLDKIDTQLHRDESSEKSETL